MSPTTVPGALRGKASSCTEADAATRRSTPSARPCPCCRKRRERGTAPSAAPLPVAVAMPAKLGQVPRRGPRSASDARRLARREGHRVTDCVEMQPIASMEALTGTRTNHHRWSLGILMLLLEHADRDRLRAAGAPLPGPGPFTLDRGVHGRGPARKVSGLHW